MTVARLLATPVFVVLIVATGRHLGDRRWSARSVACSDGVDGWLARRQGTTRSGAFLDPLADKVVVLGALFALAAKGDLPWLPVGLIAAREVGMSVYRSWAGRRGRLDPGPHRRPRSRPSCRIWPSPPAWSRRWPTTHGAAAGGDLGGRGADPGRPGRSTSSTAAGPMRRTGRVRDRDRRRRHRAAARPDRRHQLGLAGRAAGGGRRRLPLPPGGRGQPRPDRPGPAHRPGPQRRGDRVRRPRSHPGRHHPGGHRRGHGRRRSSATTGDRGPDRRSSSPSGAGRCRRTTPARPTCPTGRRSSSRHGAPPPG